MTGNVVHWLFVTTFTVASIHLIGFYSSHLTVQRILECKILYIMVSLYFTVIMQLKEYLLKNNKLPIYFTNYFLM